MYSMTGFGSATVENEHYRIGVEIKSVNHRYCDINIRLPYQLNAFEETVRQTIRQRCQRGRFEVFIKCDDLATGNFVISGNFGLIDQYVNLHAEICRRYQLTEKPRAISLLNLKDALIVESAAVDEALVAAALQRAMTLALDDLLAMRRVEGERLLGDIGQQLAQMEAVLDDLKRQAPLISQQYHAALKRRLAEMLDNSIVDEARLLTEAAIFADKTNISEELVRMAAHFDQFKAMLADAEPKGRRLDFLIQEINREVNTIGSKSPDVDISQQVVLLKSQLEKIREQVQNIE